MGAECSSSGVGGAGSRMGAWFKRIDGSREGARESTGRDAKGDELEVSAKVDDGGTMVGGTGVLGRRRS